MLSKEQLKLIKSLNQKKYRQQFGLFVVEGIKGINEFLNSTYQLNKLYTTKDIFNIEKTNTVFISEKQLSQISNLKNPNTAVAVFQIPKYHFKIHKGVIVGLDAVRDPGNLGTIIRLCDWFGVTQLICSPTTVDCYNPKVVQASMGSLTRVTVSYQNLNNILDTIENPVFGTFLEGENIYSAPLPKNAFIILGNEANGISKELTQKITQKITIPQFGTQTQTESLNVANACAIVLSEFLRPTITEK